MLENKAYNLCLKEFQTLRTRQPQIGIASFHSYLSEMYYYQLSPEERRAMEKRETTKALQAMGITNYEDIRGMPATDKVYLPNTRHQKRTDARVHLEVSGMPKSGKTTSINQAKKELVIPIYAISERVGWLKRWYKDNKKVDSMDPFMFELTKDVIYTIEDGSMQRGLRNIPNDNVIIFDRDCVDMHIFHRLQLLERNREHSRSSDGIIGPKQRFEIQAKRQEIKFGLIVCLTTPGQSMILEGQSQGSIMNMRSLGLLCDQYIRFHYEMYCKIQRGELEAPYVCLDFSRHDFEANQIKFNEAIEIMHNYYNA